MLLFLAGASFGAENRVHISLTWSSGSARCARIRNMEKWIAPLHQIRNSTP
jgi:hypothetical protein